MVIPFRANGPLSYPVVPAAVDNPSIKVRVSFDIEYTVHMFKVLYEGDNVSNLVYFKKPRWLNNMSLDTSG